MPDHKVGDLVQLVAVDEDGFREVWFESKPERRRVPRGALATVIEVTNSHTSVHFWVENAEAIQFEHEAFELVSRD